MTKGDKVAELGRELVALRKAAGLTQVQVSATTGISQSQLSRIERGDSLPSEGEDEGEDEARRLVELYATNADQQADILRRVRDARSGIHDERLVVQRGSTLAMQRRWRQLQDDAKVIRAYQPAMVLGELQAPGYAAVVFGQSVDSPEVAERMQRAPGATPGRRYVLIQTEGSLLFPVGSRRVMADQLDSIIEASRQPNVEFGVLTADSPLQVTTPVGFNLYDDTAAVVGLKVAAATLTGSADVAEFRGLFDRLADAAVFGDKARAVVTQVRARYL